MPTKIRFRSALLSLAFCPLLFSGIARSDDFKPIAPEELAMKDNPANPGSHAMILEWRDSEDDNTGYKDVYLRIKIFTEEGKKYGDIEIPYLKDFHSVSDIKARTIRPDGSILPFSGKVYDKLVVKSKYVKFQAKTFSLPDLQPGSIIEYKYRQGWDSHMLYSTHWTLQRELFVKKATFSLVSYNGPYASYWIAVGLPPGKTVNRKGSAIELELENIPAFDEEKYSPPEHELKPRIEFFYSDRVLETPEKFWHRVGKEYYEAAESFIGHRKGIQEGLESIVAANDTSETKLRKIYARVEQIRNLTYERAKTEQEEKREKLKEDKNAEDVWKNGYGNRRDINRLFVALARAAQLNAVPVLVSMRNEQFFNRGLLDARQLDSEISMVKVDGKELYFDPGTPFCPFGLLAWQRTNVSGMVLEKDNFRFVTTPTPTSRDAAVKRLVKLKLTDSGLKADIGIAYLGQEALSRRLSAMQDDEAQFKDGMEEEVKNSLPGGSTVKLRKISNAKSVDEPLVIEFDAELPDITSSVGSRKLVPLGIFEANDQNPFRHEKRVHPVYFAYPYQDVEWVTLELPEGYKIETLPSARNEQPPFGLYGSKWETSGKTVTLKRSFSMDGLFFPQAYYSQLRSFYEKVNSGDQDSLVLRMQDSAAK